MNWKVPEGRIALQLHHPLNSRALGRGGQKSPAVKKPRLQFSGTPFPPLPPPQSASPAYTAGPEPGVCLSPLFPLVYISALFSRLFLLPRAVGPVSSHPSPVECMRCRLGPWHRLTGGTGYVCRSSSRKGPLSECPLPTPHAPPGNWEGKRKVVNFLAPLSTHPLF